MKKTYGVSGMLEWHCIIKSGRSRLRLHFERGALSGYGVSPAIYSTSNPAVQHIIEHSPYFLNKRIRLLHCEKPGCKASSNSKTEKDAEASDKNSNFSDETAQKPHQRQIKSLTVRNLQEAVEYLSKNHHFIEENLLTREKLEQAAESVGLKIVIDK